VSWLRLHQRTAWICGLTLLLPLLLYLDVIASLWGVRQASQSGIDRLEPRIARLQGLINYEAQLREAAIAVDSQVLNLVYPASEDRTAVSATLQTNVRDIFTKAGLAVTNSQVLPVREQGNFDYIGVKLTVSGELPGLDEALAGIAAYLPLVLVESLDVYPTRATRGRSEREQQVITASLQLLSLRAAQ
jgi:general secretion pathway protein M